MTTLKIIRTMHYKKYHERSIPWSLVIETIFTGKQRKKGNGFIEFKGRNVYVFCKHEKIE
jgi:hypothetical protein